MYILFAIKDTNFMAFFIIIPIFLLIIVTPFRVSLRGIFNSIRKYSATNLTLLGFLLTMKIRLKLENNRIYYSINNKDAKIIKAKENKSNYNIDIVKAINLISIDRINIKIKYGIADNAMRTALESSAVYNTLMLLSKFIKVDKFNLKVISEFNSELLAIDIDIKARFAILQIFIIILHIIGMRKKRWKTLKV